VHVEIDDALFGAPGGGGVIGVQTGEERKEEKGTRFHAGLVSLRDSVLPSSTTDRFEVKMKSGGGPNVAEPEPKGAAKGAKGRIHGRH
jgi:hypothetical protein